MGKNGIYILSYSIVGLEIVRKAFRNIRRGKVFDENFLMTVATMGAFVIGNFRGGCCYVILSSRRTIPKLCS